MQKPRILSLAGHAKIMPWRCRTAEPEQTPDWPEPCKEHNLVARVTNIKTLQKAENALSGLSLQLLHCDAFAACTVPTRTRCANTKFANVFFSQTLVFFHSMVTAFAIFRHSESLHPGPNRPPAQSRGGDCCYPDAMSKSTVKFLSIRIYLRNWIIANSSFLESCQNELRIPIETLWKRERVYKSP